MKALAYLRVSKEIQDTQSQRTAILRWAEHGEHRIVGWHEDKISASRVRARSRPGWKALRASARPPRVEAVVVFRLDRAFRNVVDALGEIYFLHQLGVKFVSISEALDMTTPAGEFMATLLAALAQLESRILSERIKAGLVGKFPGRPRTISEDQGRELLRLHHEGESYRKLAARFRLPRTTVRRAVAYALEDLRLAKLEGRFLKETSHE